LRHIIKSVPLYDGSPYIPFSRLLHMILTPLLISINAISPTHGTNDENQKGENRDFGFKI
jgi:hypothetical protein